MARRRRLTGHGTAASALPLAPMTPQAAQADAAVGRRLAQQWCVSSHVEDLVDYIETLKK